MSTNPGNEWLKQKDALFNAIFRPLNLKDKIIITLQRQLSERDELIEAATFLIENVAIADIPSDARERWGELLEKLRVYNEAKVERLGTTSDKECDDHSACS